MDRDAPAQNTSKKSDDTSDKAGQMELNELKHANVEPRCEEEDKKASIVEPPLDQSATVELIEIPSLCLAGTTEPAQEPQNALPDEKPSRETQEPKENADDDK